MSLHSNVNSLTIEAVQEYLDVAEHCVRNKKGDGGIYGYPATLLLFCVINAIGESTIEGNEPFRVLKAEPFNLSLSDTQVKQLEQWYRNLLTHNAMIAPGAILSPEECGDPFVFASNEPVMIRVKPLYNSVHTAWDRLDKTKMNCDWRPQKRHAIKNPVDLSLVTQAVAATASGSMTIPNPSACSALASPVGRKRK